MRSTRHPTADVLADRTEVILSMEIRRFIETLYDAGERLAGVIEHLPRSRAVNLSSETYSGQVIELAQRFERALSYTHDEEGIELMAPPPAPPPTPEEEQAVAEPQEEPAPVDDAQMLS